jgi:hypothetical protein
MQIQSLSPNSPPPNVDLKWVIFHHIPSRVNDLFLSLVMDSTGSAGGVGRTNRRAGSDKKPMQTNSIRTHLSTARNKTGQISMAFHAGGCPWEWRPAPQANGAESDPSVKCKERGHAEEEQLASQAEGSPRGAAMVTAPVALVDSGTQSGLVPLSKLQISEEALRALSDGELDSQSALLDPTEKLKYMLGAFCSRCCFFANVQHTSPRK